MNHLTTAHRPATCSLDGPFWCPAILDADDAEHHVHSTFSITPVIHTIDPRTDKTSSLCVDIEQTDADPRPVIVLHGTAIDETYTLADAERIACEILARVITARARQAVAA